MLCCALCMKDTFKVDDLWHIQRTAKVILKTDALLLAVWGKKDLKFVINDIVCGRSIVLFHSLPFKCKSKVTGATLACKSTREHLKHLKCRLFKLNLSLDLTVWARKTVESNLGHANWPLGLVVSRGGLEPTKWKPSVMLREIREQ